jgi:hypothetical protein
MKDTCPTCGGPKDTRATTCIGCRPTNQAFRQCRRKPYTREFVYNRLLDTAVPRGDCLLATKGAKVKGGYRRVEIENVGIMVHRLVYEVAHGVTLDPLVTIDHLCHNADWDCPGGPTCPHRLCINIEHLGEASLAENWTRADTWRRRRARTNAACMQLDHQFPVLTV